MASASVVCGALLGGCTIGEVSQVDGSEQPSSADTPKPTGASASDAPKPTQAGNAGNDATPSASRAADGVDMDAAQRALEGAVAQTERETGARVGVAVAGQEGTAQAGEQGPFVSWSTIKVPIAIAAERQGTAPPGVVDMAITYSDNDAALTLWNGLGERPQAGQAVAEIIAEGVGQDSGAAASGSGAASRRATPRVSTELTRPGFSAFGQTAWSVSDQADFASGLRCIEGSNGVVAAMQRRDPAQGYGLATIDGAALKGGWGPTPAGIYEARQMGIADLGGTEVALAIYAESPDGSYESGQRALDALVKNLDSARSAWPRPAC